MGTTGRSGQKQEITDRLHKLASYFSACIDLRNSIALQREDELFARETRGSIRYVLDSNLVRFFLDPMRESDYVNPFSGEDTPAYRKLAVITAEFIFSREMEGQWGVPACISPEHMVELANHMHRLSNRLNEHANILETTNRSQDDATQDEIIRLAQSGGDIAASVEAFNSATTSSRSSDSDDAMMRELREAQMLDRMRRQDLLLPMHLDENATAEVMTPSAAAVQAWVDRIKTQRREKNAKSRRNPKQDEADATTAEQIVQLNRNVRDGALAPTRYVLITLDRNLFNAAVEWWDADGKLELDFFPFRRISQYIPFLNTERLPNDVRTAHVNTDLREALDSLLGMGTRRRHKIPLYIPESTVTPPKETFAGEVFTPLKWISDQWEDVAPVQRMIVELWRDMTERVNYLNPELLSRRDEAFENFREYLSNSPNTRQAAVTYLRQAVEKLDKFNLELSIAHSIASEIVKRPPQQAAQAVRGMPVLREQFALILNDQPLYPLLDRVVLDRDVKPLSRIVQSIEKAELWRSAFFAGCVAFWVGQWDSAAVYAQRALAIADQSERRAELTYFRVLTARFAALDMPNNTGLDFTPALTRIHDELSDMEGQVEEMIQAAAESDLFAQCRARTERVLWNLSLAYVEAFRYRERIESTKERVAAASDELRGLDTKITNLAPDDIPVEALKTMQIENLIATGGTLIFQEWFGGAAIDEDTKETVARRIDAWVRQNPSVAPSFYKVALPLLRKSPEAGAEIGRILKEEHQMTWFDRMALTQMQDMA